MWGWPQESRRIENVVLQIDKTRILSSSEQWPEDLNTNKIYIYRIKQLQPTNHTTYKLYIKHVRTCTPANNYN